MSMMLATTTMNFEVQFKKFKDQFYRIGASQFGPKFQGSFLRQDCHELLSMISLLPKDEIEAKHGFKARMIYQFLWDKANKSHEVVIRSKERAEKEFEKRFHPYGNRFSQPRNFNGRIRPQAIPWSKPFPIPRIDGYRTKPYRPPYRPPMRCAPFPQRFHDPYHASSSNQPRTAPVATVFTLEELKDRSSTPIGPRDPLFEEGQGEDDIIIIASASKSSDASSDENKEGKEEVNQEKENKEESHPFLAQFKDLSDQVASLREDFDSTSMSRPQASRAAAYVKAAYHDWSPAAIKSALMTTVTTTVYVLTPRLNRLGISTSFSLAMVDGQPIYGVYTRTVTNVGSPNATYNVCVSSQPGFTICVEPKALSFSNVGEKKSFTVKVTGPKIAQQPIISGAIIWIDSNHKYVVRSPVVVYNVLPTPYFFYGYSISQKKPTFQCPSMYHKNGILGSN
ncbi:hypothetical protein CCACVL1_29630 [Corchorus capsularis]|uniref:Subtilisin-like protease fibronectin type-III domain-containing protein n=1 Tax=Corchorus capsularis TaxID=210143 RepID=A0A1R3G0X1_COCAP|nr:hypothetical protein CCACVL1_29630 [Corchorus capsularis]